MEVPASHVVVEPIDIRELVIMILEVLIHRDRNVIAILHPVRCVDGYVDGFTRLQKNDSARSRRFGL